MAAIYLFSEALSPHQVITESDSNPIYHEYHDYHDDYNSSRCAPCTDLGPAIRTSSNLRPRLDRLSVRHIERYGGDDGDDDGNTGSDDVFLKVLYKGLTPLYKQMSNICCSRSSMMGSCPTALLSCTTQSQQTPNSACSVLLRWLSCNAIFTIYSLFDITVYENVLLIIAEY